MREYGECYKTKYVEPDYQKGVFAISQGKIWVFSLDLQTIF